VARCFNVCENINKVIWDRLLVMLSRYTNFKSSTVWLIDSCNFAYFGWIFPNHWKKIWQIQYSCLEGSFPDYFPNISHSGYSLNCWIAELLNFGQLLISCSIQSQLSEISAIQQFNSIAENQSCRCSRLKVRGYPWSLVNMEELPSYKICK